MLGGVSSGEIISSYGIVNNYDTILVVEFIKNNQAIFSIRL